MELTENRNPVLEKAESINNILSHQCKENNS